MIVCYAEGMKDPKFRAGYVYALKQAGKLEEYIEARQQWIKAYAEGKIKRVGEE